jgi:eukaryotic-like serine/threonine-protein kinase
VTGEALDMTTVESERLRSVLAEHSLTLDRELGRGGMSVVYLARDLRHNRLVAVKILRPDVPTGAERFVREIETISPLVHPNIVPLFDSGVAAGIPYFVMPYIEGESLRCRLQRDGWLSIADAVRIAGEIGEALEFAHGRDILHRDIKPENILLEAGHAVVTDFGVARALSEAVAGKDSRERLTDQGLILGTAEYMSPEQASGDPTVDGRTDVYSLGCVLYEMLTGVPPFTGDNPSQVLARRFRESPRPVREFRPEVSPHLEAVVERAIAADPADRFATATEFLAALRSPADVLPRAAPTHGRRRLRWIIGVVGAAAVVGLSFRDTGQPRFDPRRIVVARLSNQTGDSSFSYLSPLATDHLTASLAGAPGIMVVTSATVMPSRRLIHRLEADSLDDPERLRLLAQETAAGTVVSGSYFKSGNRIAFQAEITDANDGTLLEAVGPVTSPVDRSGEAMDSLGRGLEAAIRRQLHTGAAPLAR